jgi:hypothetical protein
METPIPPSCSPSRARDNPSKDVHGTGVIRLEGYNDACPRHQCHLIIRSPASLSGCSGPMRTSSTWAMRFAVFSRNASIRSCPILMTNNGRMHLITTARFSFRNALAFSSERSSTTGARASTTSPGSAPMLRTGVRTRLRFNFQSLTSHLMQMQRNDWRDKSAESPTPARFVTSSSSFSPTSLELTRSTHR